MANTDDAPSPEVIERLTAGAEVDPVRATSRIEALVAEFISPPLVVADGHLRVRRAERRLLSSLASTPTTT
jgi:hypothetical protein